METQEELKIGIGNIESEKQTLKPVKVNIVKVQIENIEKSGKTFKKVVCEVKHPDKEEHIRISSVSYIRGKEVVNKGLFLNLDRENNIQKGSSLAILLEKLNAKNIAELEGKECDTDLDEQYLCFKAY